MDKEIYLVGFPITGIVGRKLPTFKDVLALFFYNHKVQKCGVKQSALFTVTEVQEQWKKAQILTYETLNVINKLLRMFKKWQSLQRSYKRRQSFTLIKNETVFKNKLKELFDIAHTKAAKTLSKEENEFLLAQRSSDQRGFIDNFPQKPLTYEELMEVDEENSDELVDNSTITPSQDSNISSSQSTLTISQSTISHVSNFEDELSLPKVTSKMSIMTPELVAALDRGNVSSRNATYIIAATSKIVGYDLNDVNLSYSTIRRARISLREAIARELKEQLKLDDNYVVHWDGKLLSDIVGSDTVDRLPINLSSSGEEQLLGVPKINSGTGIEQARAVHSILDQWGVSRYVKAVCFDTAVTNTGIYHGAGVELEKALGRELIWLPRRHHMFEIILKSVFEVYWPKQTGPNVPIFNRFKGFWNKIDKSKFKAGIEDTAVDQALSDITDEILGFIGEYLQKYHPRSDYREFLELSSVFLGVVPKENFSFKSPGAMSHARWMSKAIYCLKIFIFREELKLTTYEINSLREICKFIITNYITAWFTSTSATLAAQHDLIIMQKLIRYKAVNLGISTATTEKMKNHLWYLSEKLAVISLFDGYVKNEVKEQIIVNLKNRDGFNTKAKKLEIRQEDIEGFLQKDMSDFVSKDSMFIFTAFDLPYDFMERDVNFWPLDESYNECVKFFDKFTVVNDVAERGVALIEHYNKCFTKYEEQLQYLLLVISEYRKKFPNCNKTTLMSQG